jgi:DNA repair exonuclease SbcCD ATPase subunit
MRLIELEIEYVRGITHALLKPSGQNFVVSGPNGSGKSAVVDAIDFLMTGEITRLTGKGTGGITLAKHGPHIDHNPEEAKVRALIRVNGVDNSFEISRCMAHPKQLQCPEEYRSTIEPVITLAKRGQHVLIILSRQGYPVP